jgi:hypothetical protein
MEEPICFQCKKRGVTTVCGNCRVASYCKECFKEGWKTHKFICRVLANNFPLDYRTAAKQIYTSSDFQMHFTYLTELIRREFPAEKEQSPPLLALVPFVLRAPNSLRTLAVYLTAENFSILQYLAPQSLFYGLQLLKPKNYTRTHKLASFAPAKAKEILSTILVINEADMETVEVSFTQSAIKEKDQASFDVTYNLYIEGLKRRGLYDKFVKGEIMLYFMGTMEDGELKELNVTGFMPVS